MSSYLKEEEMLCDILHKLLFSIFWVELGQEVKSNWLLFRYFLIQNLQYWSKKVNNYTVVGGVCVPFS